MREEDPYVFLVYTENKEEAFNLAMAHKYDKKSLEKFYRTYKEEKYHDEIKCVM